MNDHILFSTWFAFVILDQIQLLKTFSHFSFTLFQSPQTKTTNYDFSDSWDEFCT